MIFPMMISGLTADFDRLFELSWKTLKEYMQNSPMMQEAKTGSPREIIKLAYRESLIDDEQVWISILKDRNDDTVKRKYVSVNLGESISSISQR